MSVPAVTVVGPVGHADPVDVRLLVPALAAWALGAATLAAPPPVRIGAGAALLGPAALALWAPWARGRRPFRALGGRAPGRHAADRPGAGVGAVLLSVVAVGLVLAASGLQATRRDVGPVRALAAEGAVITATATVAGDPRGLPPRPGRAVGLVLVHLTLREVEGRGRRSVVGTRVLLLAPESWSAVRRGERVRVSGRLALARPEDDVAALLVARRPPTVVAAASAIDRGAERVRAGLRRAVQPLPPDARGLLPGLVDGDTSLQPADLREAMRATGLTHLSAVSGANTTLVCALALAVARGIGLGRRARLVAALLVLAGFVVLARPDPSVLRAAAMGLVGLLAVADGRRRAALPALSAAMLALLVIDPWLARSYGFALSVVATLGLLLLAPPWAEALARRVPRAVAVAFAVPLAAEAACAPVLVLLAPQVSLISVPANALADPLVAPATVLGLAAALTSVVHPPTAQLLAALAGWPCRGIAAVARRFAAVDVGRLPWVPGVLGAVALAAALAALVLLSRVAARASAPVRRRLRRALVVAVAALVTATVPLPAGGPGWLPGPPAWPPAGWVLVACDVGQGDALVLATGPGRAVLVDAGPDPDAVDRCLRDLRVRRLDAVVLTHFHADHVDGLPGALRGRRVGDLVTTIIDEPGAQARRVRTLAARAGVPVRTVQDGSTQTIGLLSWRVLGPQRVIHEGSVPNNSSIVLWVQSRGLRLLLLGDVEPAAARLVADRLPTVPGGPTVDVLKVAHHGSALQDPDLLGLARPRLALISVGTGNDYGHPAPSLLRALADRGVPTARTDQRGDLAVLSRSGRLLLATSGPRGGPAPGGGSVGP